MLKFLAGCWESISSEIPKYSVGTERLSFTVGGSHVLELAQLNLPNKSTTTRFTLKADGADWRFCPVDKRWDGAECESWRIKIDRLSDDQIAITPTHGFTTIFRRTGQPPPSLADS